MNERDYERNQPPVDVLREEAMAVMETAQRGPGYVAAGRYIANNLDPDRDVDALYDRLDDMDSFAEEFAEADEDLRKELVEKWGAWFRQWSEEQRPDVA
ncbi:MAG: hypothetical protein QF486_04070 [Candidatus Woesearchaeota archaeon]|jgi:hypothetical protein|nr:hypothetical protein [Candidatus Woesearchaeota archaeon]MDP7181682.1 hypothetical protein [Candidatus Woesearchaeota archaeon]MDP7198771.1 hypothetical protein [Candidatus Woesearchaeota archaeon]MDP7467229.1 hypothetical protein [Candidatus Woesearchaeota archaeon]|tara:strand:+ start:344 stop:640 length:297 start_codon:yes stop_codon:yes gene_type:complete